ncbi:MAG: peptidase Ste24p [Cyanobacteria bacterium RYN_339]|nr:peptidase Ste24p [Cyanobacteria bacterium RYN_339]
MTVQQERAAIAAPTVRYLAAIAVVSNGRPLEADQRAVFGEAMSAEGLAAPIRESLLMQAAGGVEAAEVQPPPGDQAAMALFVTALTRLALELAGDRAEPLAVPEAVAATAGLPRGFVMRAAVRVSSRVQADGELAPKLTAFFFPDDGMQAIARDLAATLDPARPPKRSFARVSPSRYQHPQDRAASALLHGIAGFDDLLGFLFKHSIEKILRIYNLSGAVKVSERQFPDLYAQYLEVVARTGVRPVPELYIKGGGINAHTAGIDQPYIMLNSGAVGALTRDELDYIIGHELGHIRCEHVLYLMVGQVAEVIARVIPAVGGYISMAMRLALADWQRKAEYSCDRVGLLACQDLGASQRVNIKLAGIPGSLYPEINMDAYLEQADEFKNLDNDVLSWVYKMLLGTDNSHPWLVERAAELKTWVDSGEYAAILADGAPAAGEAPTFLPLPTLPAMAFRCAVCQTTFSLAARECPSCSAPPREADQVRRCTACGESCPGDQPYCERCVDPEARRARLAPQAALEGPPVERLRTILDRLRPAVGGLGLGPLADEPLAALAQPLGQAGHLTVVVGERGRGQQVLAGWLGDGTVVAPALDGPDAAQIGAAILPADLVLVTVDAQQLLAREEREAIRQHVLPMAMGDVALVVLNLEKAEEADDRADLRERARKFAAKTGRAGFHVYFPGDPDDAGSRAALDAFVAEARASGGERREAVWLRKSGALLQALNALLEAQGAFPGGWRDASPEERAEMAGALRQEHALALVQAEALLAARIAAMRATMAARLEAMTPTQLRNEGVGELEAEAAQIAREVGRSYLDSLERGLLARAPQALRRAAEGFKSAASPHIARDVATGEAEIRIESRRERNLVLMGLTAVGAGLLLFTGGVGAAVLGALSLAGAHGLRLDVDDRHESQVRASALQVVDAWLTQAETSLREQLRDSTALVADALQARVETAMAAPVAVSDAEATPHSVLALVRQGLALAAEAQTEGTAE